MSSTESPSASGSRSSSGPATTTTPRTLRNPAQGSADPSASLPSLWNYLEPALRHILCAPASDAGKTPTVDVAYHVGIHTAVYNYFTAQPDAPTVHNAPAAPNNGKGRDLVVSGADLYEQLDRYFADVAKDIYFGAPPDDSSLPAYYVSCFARYSAGVKSVDRLLNYVNRHYVKRSIDEDKGWLRLADVFDSIAKTISMSDTREKISERLREERHSELKRWGYEDGGDADMLAAAEACAEAASPADRIVPVSSLGLRRWRIEVAEPLLSVPKAKGKRSGGKDGDKGPKSRLARAVKEITEGPAANKPDSFPLIESLATSLKACGIRMDHPLRKKLDKLVASRNGDMVVAQYTNRTPFHSA